MHLCGKYDTIMQRAKAQPLGLRCILPEADAPEASVGGIGSAVE